MGKKDGADTQKSAAVLQAEVDEKVALGAQSQAIDIHAYKLTAIPESVWAVRTLRRLLLQNNLLEFVPEQIGLLTDLSVLYLQDNNLSDLPPEIGLLTQLNTLACHNNRLKYIPSEIGLCASLQIATFNNNCLVDTPIELGHCLKLKSLELKDNPELIIPPPYVVSQGPPRVCEYFLRVGKVKASENQSLDLAKFRLKGFPIEITSMGSYLRELVLSFNIEIKTLPYEVCELTNLVILKLEAVKLMGRLTQGMGYLTSLEQLMLANNSIVSLPSGLGNATGLKVLDLDRNYTLELPPIDVQAKGYPQNFEFMKRLAESERHGGLDLKNFKLSNLEFFKFAVCGHEIQKLDEPLERGHPWTQVTALDLSANRLGELQDIIGDFESLTSLKCNGNRLSALPECFTRLTCLQVLHLADNSFREFPAICCFGDQGNLVEEKKGVGFDVSALGIDEYEVQTVWSPGIPHQALTDLDVSGNQLHNIHKAVARISQLTSLNVAKNKVSKMPPDFRDLTSLAKIDISSNDFNVFPNDIWFCTNLTTLRVAHNRIKEIPSLIQNLKLLEELDLSFNKFTDLPVEVGTLKYLKKPLFTGNTLKGIPRNLAKGGDVAIMSFWKAMVESKRTKKFDVSNTGMVDLPTQIEHMTWLKDLNLCDNGLVRIPPQISALSLVEHLNLARNRLTTLPKEIGGMRMLRSLDITGNGVRVLPLELGLCQDLRELHYEEQMIVMPTKEVLALGVRAMTIYLRRLREALLRRCLALSGMGLTQVPKEVYDMIDLKELSVDKNAILEIEPDILNFDELEVLSANINQVQDLNFLLGDSRKPPWDRQRLGMLRTLLLRGNRIEVLPPEITRLKALNVLMMDNNQLKELPESIGKLQHLEQLSFSHNELASIPDTMSDLVELNTFNVSHNALASLPFALGKIMDLTKFVFKDNPLLEPPLEVLVKGSDFVLNYLDTCCKALKDGAIEFCSIGFYEIPRELCRITSLTKMNLSDNKISMVRNELIELENLESLNLSENNLKHFPTVLCSLSLLADLNIGHNNITRLPVQLGRLSNLKKLGLEGLQLIQPAAEISNLSAPGIVEYMRKFFRVDKGESRTLDISNVGFRKFPREIAVLGTHLTSLSLDGHQIQDLTYEIGELSELLRFTAANNQLLNLPYELGALRNVEYLDFSHNSINSFPNVHQLRSLTYLDASYNLMSALPLNIRRWTALRTLKVTNNVLQTLPEPLGELERLTFIDASDNRLTALPGSIKHLTRLGQLHLKNNSLTKVPAVVPLLTTLAQLSLSGNRILALPPALCLCTGVQTLDVSYNFLIAPPAETHEGGISSVYSYLGSLYIAQYDKQLHLTHWNLQGFPLDGNFLTSLTVMDLRHNQIRTLPPVIGFYAHVVNLNLNYNMLETLPEQIRSMHASITELHVCNNLLLKLPNGLFHLTSLIRLKLAENKLKVIPDDVSKLTMLRHLDLDFNRVQVIPEALASMSRLQDLFLEDNPIKLITPSSFSNCRSMRHLKVQVEWMDDMIAWRKDLSTFKQIQGHGVKCPPTEVLMCGSDAIWKYLIVCANSKVTKVLELSRVTFWMIEMEDARQRFYSWPEDLCRYEHLERLNLAGNFLMTVHPTVSCLTNLVELDLESNRLKSLPTSLANCTALERIMLLRNPDLASPSREITSKGSAATISFLQCLHRAEQEDVVVFEGASYRRLPIEILHLTNAVDMSISKNNIEFLPAEVRFLTNLTRLKMNKNKLVFLPDELCTLTQLKHLECETNNICAFPDELPLLTNLITLEVDGNFSANMPPEVKKHGPWLCIDYLMEVKRGRQAGHVNLRGFDLLSLPVDIITIDRPKRWQKTFVDGYVRAYTEELNKQRKRELEAIKTAELRKVREAMGLDADHVSEFSDTDAKFNATEEFCDDAVVHLAPVQVVRRRDRLRTFEMFCDSFTGWYACAIGYDSVQDMMKNAANDDDVKKKPDDIQLYDFLVRRFGPPELDSPCINCIELGDKCDEEGGVNGRYRRHKGLHKMARVGWYNVKLRTKHGPEAEWSDEENDVPSDREDEENEADLKRGVKVSDDLNDDGPSQTGTSVDSDDDSDETDEDDGHGKWGGEADDSDHEEEDAKPTLTNSMNGGEFNYVVSLDFHNNLISSIPAEVSVLRHLQLMRLSHNCLSILPREMGKMRGLTHLDLGGNRVGQIPFDFSSLVSLKVLDIRKNDFKSLPETIQFYTDLRKLNVSHNHLVNLGGVLRNCELLEEIWAQDNKLTSINPLVGNLDRLVVFNAGNNQVESIPPQLGNCAGLTMLGVYGNKIARLPPSLKKLRYLKRFMANNNLLVEVPENVMFMHVLEKLYFNGNEVATFSEALCKVETLKSIFFQKNYLEHLPAEIAGLTNVTELDLSNNLLEDLCPEIGCLTSLLNLQVSGNKLQHVTPGIAGLTNLTKLSLDLNKLKDLPEEIGDLHSLQRIWLDSNNLKGLPETFGLLTNLTELHVDHNGLYELCDSFSQLTGLKELFLHNNSLGLDKLGEFGEVLASAAGVPETLCELPNLLALSLAANSLNEKLLPEKLSRLTNLTELWLNLNNFDQLPRQVCDLPKLRYVLMDIEVDTSQTTSDYFGQVAFPPEDFEEVALTKKKKGKAKESEKKQQLNKMMGKKT